MSFTTPLILLALAGLPLLWWLLRVTPPAPRSLRFPAIRLLLGLNPAEETPARTPWWLLLLRLTAATLVIVALARPVLDRARAMAGGGPLLVVIDNGWTAAPDWSRRVHAADTALDRAENQGRRAALLVTAADGFGAPPKVVGPMPVADLRPSLGAVRPMPWPSDRAAAAPRAWTAPGTNVVYVADGMADLADFEAFSAALSAIGPVTEICCTAAEPRIVLPPEAGANGFAVHALRPPDGAEADGAVLARTADGRSLARAALHWKSGETDAAATMSLPMELRNRIASLVLEGAGTAGSVAMLDERWRRRPVGLAAADPVTADSPLTGSLFYVRRALTPFAEVRTTSLGALLKDTLSAIVLADVPLAPGPDLTALNAWVDKGGLLIRFAGPRMADAGGQDPLLAVPLLSGDRQLGGAMSWSEPAGLAPFPAGSPFSGLAVPPDVKVSRQVLAEPGTALSSHTWVSLADGTPLVTHRTVGAGAVVMFHVTANADWSNLPLSGLLPDMLNRLVLLSAGVAAAADSTPLRPAETLDGFGIPGRPPEAAQALAADAFAKEPVSPRHPPGLYGSETMRRALNLGAATRNLRRVPMVPGATLEAMDDTPRERDLAPPLMAAAVGLLLIDMILSLGLRGLFRRGIAAAVLLAALVQPGLAADPESNPALTTRLGYIVTGDSRVDSVSQAGLTGLSAFLNRRTAGTLARPDPVEPGHSDLSLYPLLYWPIVADMPSPDAQAVAALNGFMAHGGIIVIDTRGGAASGAGTGAGFAPGADEALRRVTRDLTIPPLAPLTNEHVLARSFYLLSDFPGRFAGETVWVQRDQDRANDSVSPVIIGANDWASAWAVDDSGHNPYATIPGGQRQRILAYRFGVNLMMYALTGNYKGDQVHIPAILQRLGQ